MTVFESFQAVYYTCIFLLPGYISVCVLNLLFVTRPKNTNEFILTCLLYSGLDFIICSGLYVFTANHLSSDSFWYWFACTFVSIVGACAISITIGYFRKNDRFVRIIHKITGLNTVSFHNSAWDYIFSRQEQKWVIITLKNSKIIYGFYGSNSFASDGLFTRDIFIEKIYAVDENNHWEEIVGNSGILIQESNINTIEFYEGEDNEDKN